jgi:NAD(P)-dependent dehydrogenase (short-subunit alcohol dehydrogenase family)
VKLIFTFLNYKQMENTYLVTGGSSGLGYALALELAKTGATTVILCRDAEKGKKARINLIAKSRNPNIDLLCYDLSDKAAVHAAAQEIKERYHEIHLLANIAGALYPTRQFSKDGMELNFATNVVGPFLLTHLLTDLLVKSGPARIINVSGEDHRTGAIHHNDPGLSRFFTLTRVKEQIAMARVMWTYELSRRLAHTNVTVHTFAPGAVPTNLLRNIPMLRKLPTLIKNKLFGQSAKSVMKSIVPLAIGDVFDRSTGKYFYKGKEERTVPITYDEDSCQRLWQMLEDHAGVEPVYYQILAGRF